MALQGEKKDLRQRILLQLLSLTKDEIKRRSKDVEQKLSALSIYKQAKLIMAYYPLKGEVDILSMIRKDLSMKRFCFPVMDLKEKRLRIFEVLNLDRDFIPGPFGVQQPDMLRTKEVDVRSIDMVIVPGLAFDYQKNRLGRGAGFYDRFFERTSSSIEKIGIAFRFQILENLPTHPRSDKKVDKVVSEDICI